MHWALVGSESSIMLGKQEADGCGMCPWKWDGLEVGDFRKGLATKIIKQIILGFVHIDMFFPKIKNLCCENFSK